MKEIGQPIYALDILHSIFGHITQYSVDAQIAFVEMHGRRFEAGGGRKIASRAVAREVVREVFGIVLEN